MIAALLVIAFIIAGVNLALKKAGENRILFPPEIRCELLQKDADVEVSLHVDRSNTGVYDYICAYDMDQYGNVNPTERSLWQSYTDAVPSEAYKGLKKRCPGEITAIDITETGYLARSHKDPVTTVITETDASLNPIFQYELDIGKYTAGLLTAFTSEDMLYMVSYHSDEQRTYITSVSKKTGQEQVSSFVFSDFLPGAGNEDSMGGFLFDRKNMWVKDGVLYFAETYYKGGTASVLGAYDLKENRPVCFEIVEHSQVVMVHKEPEKGQAAVLINPMGYQPLELYTIDDVTMEIVNVTPLELPYEYLTRQDSMYGAEQDYLFEGDMDEKRVAVLFGDIISREEMEDDTGSRILVVYDRMSGQTVWRGRFRMDADYEISSVALQPAG